MQEANCSGEGFLPPESQKESSGLQNGRAEKQVGALGAAEASPIVDDQPVEASGVSEPSAGPNRSVAEQNSPVIFPSRGWRLAVGVVGVGGVLAGAGAVWLLAQSIAQMDHLPSEAIEQRVNQLQGIVAAIAAGGAVGFLGAGVWLFRLGWKINRTGQYPPPGMPVVWTTRIRRGPSASVRANLALLGAVVLAAVGTVGMLWLYQQAVQALHQLLPSP